MYARLRYLQLTHQNPPSVMHVMNDVSWMIIETQWSALLLFANDFSVMHCVKLGYIFHFITKISPNWLLNQFTGN